MGRKPSTKPTSFDIAALAGVSQPTVSRALRGSKSVSLATRQKIEAIARQLGYSLDRIHGPQTHLRCPSVLLLVLDDVADDALVGGVGRACARRHLDVVLRSRASTDNWPHELRDMHGMIGVIVVRPVDSASIKARLAQLGRQGIALVVASGLDVATDAAGDALLARLLDAPRQSRRAG